MTPFITWIARASAAIDHPELPGRTLTDLPPPSTVIALGNFRLSVAGIRPTVLSR